MCETRSKLIAQVMSHVPSLDVFDDKHYQNKCHNKPALLLTVAATVAVSHDVASEMMAELR